jgi:hypothetical protein
VLKNVEPSHLMAGKEQFWKRREYEGAVKKLYLLGRCAAPLKRYLSHSDVVVGGAQMDFGGGARIDTAIHESGHAVARVLSIGRAGITNERAIRWIEMTEGNPHCSVYELNLDVPGLKEFGESHGIKEGVWPTPEQWLKIFSYIRIDPREWASVRLFELAAGAAAQAKFRSIPFDAVWLSYGCSDDYQKAVETCQRIGLSPPEGREFFVKQSKEACAAMDKIDVWRAVLTLAERLPTTDRMPGDTVISIVQNVLRAL